MARGKAEGARVVVRGRPMALDLGRDVVAERPQGQRKALPGWWRALAAHSAMVHVVAYAVRLPYAVLARARPLPRAKRERTVPLTNEDVAAVLGDVEWRLELEPPVADEAVRKALRSALADVPQFAGRIASENGQWVLKFTRTPRIVNDNTPEPLFEKNGGVRVRTSKPAPHRQAAAIPGIQRLRPLTAYIAMRIAAIFAALWQYQLLAKRVLSVELEQEVAEVSAVTLTWSHALGDAGCFARFVQLFAAYVTTDAPLPAPPLMPFEERAALARALLAAPPPRAIPNREGGSANGNLWVSAAMCHAAAPNARLVDAAAGLIAAACGGSEAVLMHDLRALMDGCAGVTGNLLRFGDAEAVDEGATAAEFAAAYARARARGLVPGTEAGKDFRTGTWAGCRGGPTVVLNDLSGVATSWRFGGSVMTLARCRFGGAMRVCASEAPAQARRLAPFEAAALAPLRATKMVTLMARGVGSEGVVVTVGAQALQGW